MEAFEPPKYIASLIAAVNDGAKSAQTGALAFTLVGLYLLATAFSTTDEVSVCRRPRHGCYIATSELDYCVQSQGSRASILWMG